MAGIKALLVSSLREIADLAEMEGDRTTMVRALRMAWKFEFRSAPEPVPMSQEKVKALAERVFLNQRAHWPRIH